VIDTKKPDPRSFYICTECGHRCLQISEPGERFRGMCDRKNTHPKWRKLPKEQAFYTVAPDMYEKPKGIEDWGTKGDDEDVKAQ